MKFPAATALQMRRAMQSAAACEAIITAEDWLRAFSYEEDAANGTALAKYDNGAGDHVFLFFTANGATIIKGFDHESEVSPHARDIYAVWPGMYDGVPQALMDLLLDEALEHEEVTFCCWSEDGADWKRGSAHIPEGMDDGANWLLGMVQMDADEFIDWAGSYYGDEFARLGEATVREIFQRAQA